MDFSALDPDLEPLAIFSDLIDLAVLDLAKNVDGRIGNALTPSGRERAEALIRSGVDLPEEAKARLRLVALRPK